MCNKNLNNAYSHYRHNMSINLEQSVAGIIYISAVFTTDRQVTIDARIQTRSMMVRKNTLLRARLPTLLQDTNLLRNVSESTNNLLITIKEREDSIWDTRVTTELKDKFLRATEVMPRDTRVEMVNSLELKTTVEEIQPCWAVHVHGSAEHFLGEGLVHAQISCGHGEVGERDLNVQWRSDHMRDQDEKDTATPVRNGTVKDTVAEPGPEENLSGDLEPAVPPGWAFFRCLAAEEILPAQNVEVESAKE